MFGFGEINRVSHAVTCFAALFGMGALGACSNDDYAADVTQQEWENRSTLDILDRQAPKQNAFDFYIRANQFSEDPDTAAYIGLVQLSGPASVRDEENGAKRLGYACEAGQMRACRTIARGNILSSNIAHRERAAEMLDESCRAGIGLACQDLALVFGHNPTSPQNRLRAIDYAERSCSEPSEDHCSYSAFALRYVAPQKSRAMLEGICRQDIEIGCHHLAKYLTEDQVGETDLPLAVKLFEANCLTGYPNSCDFLFYTLSVNDMKTSDLVNAEATAQKLCEEGSVSMCLRMSGYYAARSTMAKPAAGFRMTKRGCELGDNDMCRWLGDYYARGHGTAPDKAKAIAVLKKLCDAGDEHSCRMSVELGDGFATMTKAAKNEAMCKQGDIQSCRVAAWDYAVGKDVEQDLDRAKGLFLFGCDKGLAISCIDLGSLYDYAKFGMPEDKMQAKSLYEKACNLGDEMGCDLLQG